MAEYCPLGLVAALYLPYIDKQAGDWALGNVSDRQSHIIDSNGGYTLMRSAAFIFIFIATHQRITNVVVLF